MSAWRVTNKYETGGQFLQSLVTLGLCSSYVYEVEHVDTGETKIVSADDNFDLGDKISSGDWDSEVDE